MRQVRAELKIAFPSALSVFPALETFLHRGEAGFELPTPKKSPGRGLTEGVPPAIG